MSECLLFCRQPNGDTPPMAHGWESALVSADWRCNAPWPASDRSTVASLGALASEGAASNCVGLAPSIKLLFTEKFLHSRVDTFAAEEGGETLGRGAVAGASQ